VIGKQKFYEKTKNSLPSCFVKKIIESGIKPGTAIDLGCGAGRDTVFLLKNGWTVLAIDKENTIQFIQDKLEKQELEKLNFKCCSFEKVKFIKNDLVVANFSLPFCNINSFNSFWRSLTNSISQNRIFCGQLFWFK